MLFGVLFWPFFRVFLILWGKDVTTRLFWNERENCIVRIHVLQMAMLTRMLIMGGWNFGLSCELKNGGSRQGKK